MDNNNFGMRSLAEIGNKKPTEIYGEILKKSFTHDWIFGSWWEKLIIFICFGWGVYSLGSFLWRLMF